MYRSMHHASVAGSGQGRAAKRRRMAAVEARMKQRPNVPEPRQFIPVAVLWTFPVRPVPLQLQQHGMVGGEVGRPLRLPSSCAVAALTELETVDAQPLATTACWTCAAARWSHGSANACKRWRAGRRQSAFLVSNGVSSGFTSQATPTSPNRCGWLIPTVLDFDLCPCSDCNGGDAFSSLHQAAGRRRRAR